ncbi:MAG: hypothetical protein IPJ98_08200 [Bryobacterales bacterium]|nr:hypothetical protein [Bryobacterales bacterium]
MPRPATLLTAAAAPSLVFALALAALIPAQQPQPFPHRWVRISSQLRSDEDVEKIRRLARIASENGLTGALMAIGLDSIDLKGPDYLARLESVKDILKQNRLEMIPNIFSGGYGGAILAHDRNLAEGFEVRDLLYTVRDGQATLVPEVPLDYTGPAVDRLWTRELAVKPYRCYRVTFRAKTAGLPETRPFTSGAFRLTVQTPDNRNLTPWNARMPATSDWRETTWGFNTQGYDKVTISIGIRPNTPGTAAIDRVRVEEVGLLNVLRRSGTPITVRADDAPTVYEEGRDFAPIADPQLNFRFDHDGPPIRLLPNSRIRNGQRLRVSYYHGFSINDGQTTICMGEPKTYEIWRDLARRMHAAAAPPATSSPWTKCAPAAPAPPAVAATPASCSANASPASSRCSAKSIPRSTSGSGPTCSTPTTTPATNTTSSTATTPAPGTTSPATSASSPGITNAAPSASPSSPNSASAPSPALITTPITSTTPAPGSMNSAKPPTPKASCTPPGSISTTYSPISASLYPSNPTLHVAHQHARHIPSPHPQ